jgi:hypothetical protein
MLCNYNRILFTNGTTIFTQRAIVIALATFIRNPAPRRCLTEILDEEPNPSPLDGVPIGDIKAQVEQRVIISIPSQEKPGLFFTNGKSTINIVICTPVLLIISEAKVATNARRI